MATVIAPPPVLRACSSAEVPRGAVLAPAAGTGKTPTASAQADQLWKLLSSHFKQHVEQLDDDKDDLLLSAAPPKLERSASSPSRSVVQAVVAPSLQVCKQLLQKEAAASLSAGLPVTRGARGTCKICMEEKKASSLQSICRRECGNRFCGKCLDTYLKHEICCSYGRSLSLSLSLSPELSFRVCVYLRWFLFLQVCAKPLSALAV